MNNKNLYLYCIAQSDKEQTFHIKGLLGGEVFAFVNHSLGAIVQECEASFSSQDPQLISEWALIHQAVVDHAWEKFGSVVPLNFGNLVVFKEVESARQNLANWMVKEEEPLKRLLEKFKGKAEYGIQISWDPNLILPKIIEKDEEIKQLEEEIGQSDTGTQYLLQHEKKNILKSRLESAADHYFKDFYTVIRPQVEEIHVEAVRKENPPQQMLMKLSCLLLKEEVSKLSEDLEKIAQMKGFFVRFTGPWPPYSFATLTTPP